MKTSESKTIRVIGGTGTIIGEATIQIPLSALSMISDVDFSNIQEESPSLLSNRDMLINDQYISLR